MRGQFPVLVPTYHAALLEFRDGGAGQAVFSFQASRWHPPVWTPQSPTANAHLQAQAPRLVERGLSIRSHPPVV
jgi:hypothetical protein